MYESQVEILSPEHILRYHLHVAGSPLTYAEVMSLWQEDPEFRVFFNQQLAASPFQAFFWELPPVNWETRHRPFEFVLVDSPALARESADKSAFLEYMNGAEVATFENLGKDALLVVPGPQTNDQAYPHIANFVRHAPSRQQQELWNTVGQAIWQRLTQQPCWLNTSGLGVPWLHVRLDSRPKYYQHRPYREEVV